MKAPKIFKFCLSPPQHAESTLHVVSTKSPYLTYSELHAISFKRTVYLATLVLCSLCEAAFS